MSAPNLIKFNLEALYNNLIVLGLDTKDLENKCRFQFSRDKMEFSNQAVLQYVTHFLLTKLKPSKSTEEFSYVWPVLTPKDQGTFRKAAFNWLTHFAKENEEAKIPTLAKSMFTSPSNKRVCHVFLALSRYILQSVHKKENGQNCCPLGYPTVSPRTKHVNSAIISLHRVMLNDLVAEQMKVKLTVEARERKLVSSVNIVKAIHYKLKDKRNAIKDSLSGSRKEICSLVNNCTNLSEARELLETSCKNELKSVRKSWEFIKELHQESVRSRDIIDFVLSCSTPPCLDGQNFPIQIHPVLLQTIRNDLQKANVFKVQENNKLHLMNLFKIFQICLPTLSDPLKELLNGLALTSLTGQISSLQLQLTAKTQTYNRIESEDKVKILRNINEMQRLNKPCTEGSPTVNISGQKYSLQRASPDIGSFSFSSFTDSPTQNLMNITPIKWLQSPQSDDISSPDLRRRVLVRNSLSPTKPVRITSYGKVKERVLPHGENSVSNQIPILKTRVQHKKLTNEIADQKSRLDYMKLSIQSSKDNINSDMNSNFSTAEQVSNCTPSSSDVELNLNILEKGPREFPETEVTEQAKALEYTAMDNAGKMIQKPFEEDQHEDIVNIATPKTLSRSFDVNKNIASPVTDQFNYDFFAKPVLSLSNASGLCLSDSFNSSFNNSLIDNQTFPECPNFDITCNSDLDASTFLLSENDYQWPT